MYLLFSDNDSKYKTWYSIFPIDNYDLMYGDWEKDIIIDPEVGRLRVLMRKIVRFVFRIWNVFVNHQN